MIQFMVKLDVKEIVILVVIQIQDLLIVKNVNQAIIMLKDCAINVQEVRTNVLNVPMKKKIILMKRYLNALNAQAMNIESMINIIAKNVR